MLFFKPLIFESVSLLLALEVQAYLVLLKFSDSPFLNFLKIKGLSASRESL